MIVAYSRPIAMRIYYKLLEMRPKWAEKLGVVMTSDNNDPVPLYTEINIQKRAEDI